MPVKHKSPITEKDLDFSFTNKGIIPLMNFFVTFPFPNSFTSNTKQSYTKNFHHLNWQYKSPMFRYAQIFHSQKK